MKTAEHGPDLASLRVLVDSLPALIHTGLPDGYLDFFNQRWLEFVGLRLEDLEGWKWTAAVHPDDVTGLVAGWRACLASGEPLEFEARVRRADGEYRWMLHHKVALRDESGRIVKWYGSSIDIEDRKQAECRSRELRQILDLTPPHLEAHLQATLNVIPAHTWYAPPSGALTFVNARCADYLGLPKDHPLRFGIDTGAPWDSHIPLLHPDDREESRRVWSTCLSTGNARDITFRVRNAEGTYRWFLSRVEPLRANDGMLLYWVGVNLEIEERIRAEEALQRVQAELAHVSRVTTLGELAASIAHEVNQPLAAIVNNASACLSLLSHGRADVEELRTALADINGDAKRASAVIERVRAMAKRSAPDRIPVRLTDLVHEVVALTRAESATRRVAIRTDVPADLPLVLGDRVQLQQVLLNLVVNAMDAMSGAEDPERSIDIRGRADERDGSPAVTISVEDRGVGLQPEELDRLFEAFHTTKPHGLGLGLAISRSIIEAHGGRLWGESQRGRGAVFSFRLPAAETSRTA